MTEARIESRFLEMAALRPDAVALSWATGALSYGALAGLSRYYAALAAAGGGNQDVVAILAERGPRVVVAMLACARAGRPFVVLDGAYPPARLHSLIAQSRPTLLLLAADPAPGQDFNIPAIEVSLEAPPAAPDLAAPGSPDDVAYLLFTSGSTGQPKGVAVPHRPLVNFVFWQSVAFGLGAEDRFTLLSGLSHDPVLRDVFTPLSLGATLLIPGQATLTEPGGLHAWFAAARPTAAHMTPQLGHLLTAVRPGAERLPELRHVFFGGDMLRGDLVGRVQALAPNATCVNFYGATETPQAAAFHIARADEPVCPVGVGIDGFALEVVGEDGSPAPAGETGEIVVRSAFLTLGYLENARFPKGPAQAVYATGDVGYARPDGAVVVQGRRDDQVKVRGYRVELAEITAAALKHPAVAQAITLNVGTPDAVRLCSFVEAADPSQGVDGEALRARIGASLPPYMVPDTVTVVARMPLLPNGKIDRQALLAPRDAATSTPKPAAASPAEAELVTQWAGIFRGAEVTPASSFAGLGGDSLSYVNAYLSLEEALGHVPAGWTTMSLRELAALKSGARRSFFTEVESAMVLRAAAISTVVASHFGLVFSGGAATSTLFWISGFLFGGLQMHEVDQQRSLTPIARLLRSILLPLFALTLPILALKVVTGHEVMLSSFVLNVDLMDFTGMPPDGDYGGHDYLMWFVHCMIHMLFILAALLLVFQTLLKAKDAVLKALVAAVGIGLAARFILPAFFLPDFGRTPVDGLSIFGHSPTAHLATFALAALTGFLRGRWRWAMLGLTMAYAAVSIPTYGLLDSLAIGAAAALLFAAPKLRVPRLLTKPIYMIAGASLFIYLLHFRFLQVLHEGPGLHLPTPVALVGAIGGGVVVWSLWNWGMKVAAEVWGRVSTRFPWPGVSSRSSAAA